MMNLKRFLSAAGATVLLAALAGCNGKEDFSNVDLPGCPAGALCEENPVGDVLVEFIGLDIFNLGYRCGASIAFISEDPQVLDDGRVVPAGAAVCPPSATRVDFFLGDAFYLGNFLAVGAVALPQLSALTRQDENGDDWQVVQLTLADVVTTARRQPATDARVRNRAALLLALDEDTATPGVQVPALLNGRQSSEAPDVGLINERFDELVRGRSLDTADYEEFKTAWQPLLDALAVETGASHVFPLEAAIAPILAPGIGLVQAGLYGVAYQSTFFTAVGNEKRLQDGYQASLDGEFLVLPTGEMLGMASVLLAKPGGGGSTDTYQDLAVVGGQSRLDAEQKLVDVSLGGLEIDGVPSTALSLVGRVLGSALYHGVAGPGGRDFALDLPGRVYQPESGDFGRMTGNLLGETAEAMLLNPATAPVGLPLTLARESLSAKTLDDNVLAEVAGVYRLTMRRGCTQDEVANAGCDQIAEKDLELNYPQTYEMDDGEVFRFTHDTAKGNLGGATGTSMLIEIRHQPPYALIYAGEDGQCPAVTSDIPVGYVTRTFADNGNPHSANVLIYLTTDAEDADQLYQLGSQIQGRIDLGDASHPIYRLADDSFGEQIKALWIDNYLPTRNFAGLDPDNITDEQWQRHLSYVQGAVDLSYLGANCPAVP